MNRSVPAKRARLPRRLLRAGLISVALAAALLAGCRTIEEAIYDTGVSITRYRAGVSVETVQTESHGTLAYLHREGSGPTVVFLHGFAAQKELWLPLILELPEHFGIVALDLPGHGRSDRVSDAGYRTSDFTDTLVEALDEIGLDTFQLAGSSYGGMIALRYALRHPERVDSLGLFSPAAFHPPETSEVERRIAAGENPLFVEDRADFDELTELLFHERPFMPWPVASVLTRRSAEYSEHRALMWREVWEHRREIKEELTKVENPVFLLWGENDRVVDVSGVEVFEKYLTNAPLTLVIMEETGHSPMLERPEEVAAEYVKFLESLDP